MAPNQYYSEVAGDESADLLVGEKVGATRAPPTLEKKKRSLWRKVGYGILLTIVYIAAVAVASSALVSYRTNGTTQAAAQTNVTAEASVQEPVKEETTTTTVTPNIIYNKTVEMKDCGSSPEQARAKGCVFDVMMQLWTPPECYDHPLSERFLEQGNWTWWADPSAEHVLTLDQMRKGEHPVIYVAQSYHRHHCIFAWERLVRAMRNQAPLIEELISYDHVMHCRKKTLTPPEEGGQSVRGVIAPTGYTRCASYDVWINNNLPFNKMSSVDK